MLSFAEAAAQLVADGVAQSMTAEGLRKLARDPDATGWPIGPDDYRVAGRTRLLPYELLVPYMQARRPGRGPDVTKRAAAQNRGGALITTRTDEARQGGGLLAFLRARLSEDEAAARAAGPGSWQEYGIGSGGWTVGSAQGDDHFGAETSSSGPEGQAQAAHIARHDPARVLTEVEAKQRILRAHEKWCEGRCEAKYPEGGFDAAHYWSIKSLAAVYADHPDYDESWRP